MSPLRLLGRLALIPRRPDGQFDSNYDYVSLLFMELSFVGVGAAPKVSETTVVKFQKSRDNPWPNSAMAVPIEIMFIVPGRALCCWMCASNVSYFNQNGFANCSGGLYKNWDSKIRASPPPPTNYSLRC